ncbi:DUF2726 domain-containing protein [Vibrio cholerae]|uniref:DUF2726 domain-containing protein n=1 Tax=Vibrio parahaemolyticus TaxID=670 RepID=A0A1B1LRX2_VIBPH|nr:hypothetical protein [Vibrio parahaemolyticus]EJL6492594.1 DUF2726 domain-containing protein [Vibrio cholerae]EJL6644435.1 DUF2726 domain-containing protein [Vibrio cholerae]MCI9701763.1 DUF2726 domain-containing protein [Vibrio parahaemolyticus]HBC3548344.1 DUF2726 domain-containing protein [Vibrio parahaemolyticus]
MSLSKVSSLAGADHVDLYCQYWVLLATIVTHFGNRKVSNFNVLRHQKKSRKDRDDFVELACKSAGLPLYRCRAQYVYQPNELRDYLFVNSTQQSKDVASEEA